jgi:hypothetical protein
MRAAARGSGASARRAGGRTASGGSAVEEAGFEPAHGLATAGILVHDLLAVPLPLVNGGMAVPAIVELDEDEVDRYTLERFEARP